MNDIKQKLKFLVIFIILFTVKVSAQKIKFIDKNLKSALIELGYDFNKNGITVF